MFGICGILNIDKQPVDLALLKYMMGPIHSGGPDNEGIYNCKNIGMGVRRLSEISFLTALQPISNEDKSIWAVHNGEIINCFELRREMELKGHVYKTESDAEIIIHLYEEYGERFAEKLNGMFVIALWDERREKLILVRDRIGIKPLFYFFNGHKLLFASEINSILKDSNVKREIDMIALNHYLTYRFIPAPLTMLNNIKKLLPGHKLIYKKGQISHYPYWNLEFDESSESKKYYLDRLHEILRESIQRNLPKDLPVGVFLSGGIDSSIIACIMSELVSKPIKTFSITFGDEHCDESRYARMVADRLNTEHHELMVKPDAIQVLPRLICHMDEPMGNSSALAIYHLLKFAREYVTVALGGDGGDELFAGYDRYRREKFVSFYGRIPQWIRERAFGLTRKFPQINSKVELFNKSCVLSLEKRYKSWIKIISEEARRELIKGKNFSDIGLCDFVLEYFEGCNSAKNLNKMLYVDMKTCLPDDLLIKVYQMSKAHSLAVKVPFLDKEVVEFAATIPINLKLRGFTTTKYLLRKYLKKNLPAVIYKRKKQGFNLPVDSWFRGELKDFAYQILLDPVVKNSGIFNFRGLEFILGEHQNGKNFGEAIWALIVFELWRRQHIDV